MARRSAKSSRKKPKKPKPPPAAKPPEPLAAARAPVPRARLPPTAGVFPPAELPPAEVDLSEFEDPDALATPSAVVESDATARRHRRAGSRPSVFAPFLRVALYVGIAALVAGVVLYVLQRNDPGRALPKEPPPIVAPPG